jgi:hypothetical protein
MGIRDKPICPASPWQNGFAERLIGSIRRECLDHLVVLSEAHLWQILQSYADYYNKIRTHWSLGKDAPCFRPVRVICYPRWASSILCSGLGFRYTQPIDHAQRILQALVLENLTQPRTILSTANNNTRPGLLRRSTMICCPNTMISVSSAARSRNRSMPATKITLQRSSISQKRIKSTREETRASEAKIYTTSAANEIHSNMSDWCGRPSFAGEFQWYDGTISDRSVA